MALFRSRSRRSDPRRDAFGASTLGQDGEDPVVRQYRFLLRTAPLDALEAAHTEALRTLPVDQRALLLRTAQEQLVSGLRLVPEDAERLAHLLTLGERRQPGALLRACDPALLRVLAQAVIDTEAVFGLFSGYAGWDGHEPEPQVGPGDMAGFDESWHQKLTGPSSPRRSPDPMKDVWGAGSGM